MTGLVLMSSWSEAADLNAYGTTLLRYEDHSIGVFGKQRTGVGTQYIGMDLDKLGNGNFSVSLYGWGRTDLSGESSPNGDNNADFTYGYLRYRFPDTSSELTAGRFFIYGRGISSYIDGLSLKSDLSFVGTRGGIGLQFFSGTPVKTDHIIDNRGDFLTGSRISYRFPNLLEVGVASLYETGLAANGADTAFEDYRNTLVGDVWFSPYRAVDLTGHTSYNTVTRGIAENRYLISLRPIDKLFATLEYNSSIFKDLFSNSSQRYLFYSNSGDKVTSYGGTATYTLFPFLDLSADYRYSLRSGRADTSRVGGGAILKLAENRIRSGLSWHRYDVGEPTLVPEGFRVVSFNEIRGFILYDNAVYTASLDTIADVYDKPIHDKDVGYELIGSLGYRLMPNIKLSCDLSMADNPQFSNEIKGVARLVFSHGMTEKPRLDYRARHAADSSPAAVVGQAKSLEQPGTTIKPDDLVAVAGEEPVSVAGAAGKTDEMAGGLPAVESSPGVAVKPSIKTAQEQPSAGKPDVVTVYRIDVQDILSRNRANKIVTHLKSMGCGNVRLQTVEKDLPMHRLFVAEQGNLSLAKNELKKLRKIAAGAFLLKSGGRYQLYAGSFREPKNAVAEQKRLSAYGMKITIRDGIRVTALLHAVTADVADRSSGEALVQKLKKHGMYATLNLSGRAQESGPESGIKGGSGTVDEQDPDRIQINWLLNELKRRGVDTSTIIVDDESESEIDPGLQDAVLLSAGMTSDKGHTFGDSLSEVIK